MDETGIFTLEIIQQDRWPPGTAEIPALIRVTARPRDHRGDGRSAVGVAEVIIMDCSGSMGKPVAKLHAAQRAAHAALDAMRDGVEFAVLSGTAGAEAVYPRDRTLVRAGPDTRGAAKRAVDQLYANGGTKISSWLSAARQLLEPYPGHIRHAMLFTDGDNKHEPEGRTLDEVLDACRGIFTCDARGIGDQWEPRDLRRIVTALHGRADGLPDVADLENDFRAVMRAAMRKAVPSVALRLRTLPGVTVREIRQIYPTDADLTGHGEAADGTAADYWTGSWSDEIRDYLVKLAVTPRDFPTGREAELARVEVMAPGPAAPRVLTEPGSIVACWTSEVPQERTWLPSDKYVIQRTAGDATTAGCQAWLGGDFAGAEAAWGEAVRLAGEASDTQRLTALESLVRIVDVGTGQVRLRNDLSRAVVLRADLRADVSSFVPDHAPDQDREARDRDLEARDRDLEAPDGPAGRIGQPALCPDCGRRSPSAARFCEKCGRPLGAAGPGRNEDGDGDGE